MKRMAKHVSPTPGIEVGIDARLTLPGGRLIFQSQTNSALYRISHSAGLTNMQDLDQKRKLSHLITLLQFEPQCPATQCMAAKRP